MTDTPADDLVIERLRQMDGTHLLPEDGEVIAVSDIVIAFARLRQKLEDAEARAGISEAYISKFEADRNHYRDALTLAQSQRDALAMAIERAGEVFREYEELHRRKGTSEGNRKADANLREAKLCERALASARAQAMGE